MTEKEKAKYELVKEKIDEKKQLGKELVSIANSSENPDSKLIQMEGLARKIAM